MITVVKFFTNPEQGSVNPVITRTLGKIGVISREYTGEMPAHDEFWRVSIALETKPGAVKGCFILVPQCKLVNPPVLLIAGMYTEQVLAEANGAETIVYYPKLSAIHQDEGWVLSLEKRRDDAIRNNVIAHVVYHGGPRQWETRK